MPNWTTNCKGTIKTKKGKETPCPEEVTYVPDILRAGIESGDIAEFDVNLTCEKFRHTRKYWVTRTSLR
jgi:hypothetical protein